MIVSAAVPDPAVRLFADEVVVDMFAGGGGTSTGIEMALGRPPDVAINHNRKALAMHLANHPTTRHMAEDVRDVNPPAPGWSVSSETAERTLGCAGVAVRDGLRGGDQDRGFGVHPTG